MTVKLEGWWIQDPRFAGLDVLSPWDESSPSGVEERHETDLQNVHMLVRKRLYVSGKPIQARLRITADDYYKLFVNGCFVGQGPAPGYPSHYNVNTWDIARSLAAGKNILAVHVYYQGLRNRVWNSGDYRQGMLAELRVECDTGESRVCSTDETWKIKISSAWKTQGWFAYKTQFTEDIDARLFEVGWRENDYDDSAWETPALRQPVELGYRFFLQDTPPLTVQPVAPRAVQAVGPDRYVIDFGHEIVGQFAMRVAGAAGHVVEIRHGEELSVDGSVRCPVRCGCNYREFWTLSGRAHDTLEFYDYRGFRYVEILGAPCTLDTENTWAVARHYPLAKDAAHFESSDVGLNAVWDICARGVRMCAQEQFVDCPTREKGQYLNDCAITAHAHMLLTGDGRLARKSLRDFALSRSVRPGLLSVAPGSVVQEIADASLLWPRQLWQYFRLSGDRDFVAGMLPVAEGVLAHFGTYEDGSGLLVDVCDKWNLVDWPAHARDEYDFDLDPATGGKGCQTVLNAYYYDSLCMLSRIRMALGHDVRPLESKRNRLRRAFRNAFQDPDTGCFVDAVGSKHSSLHANALPLCFGLVPQEARASVVHLLQSKRMACGVFTAYFLLAALMENHQEDLVWDLMCCGEEHSWQNMLRDGATACMEVWGAEQKWNTSFCHAWAAGPIPLLIEHVMGLRPLREGWDGVRLAPRIPASLDAAELALPVPAGTLFAKVTRRSGLKAYELCTPPGLEVETPAANGWTLVERDRRTGRHVLLQKT